MFDVYQLIGMARCESHGFPLAWNQFVRGKARRTNDPNYERTHWANYHPTKDRTPPPSCSSCCGCTKHLLGIPQPPPTQEVRI